MLFWLENEYLPANRVTNESTLEKVIFDTIISFCKVFIGLDELIIFGNWIKKKNDILSSNYLSLLIIWLSKQGEWIGISKSTQLISFPLSLFKNLSICN